jgi:hypothetical protein
MDNFRRIISRSLKSGSSTTLPDVTAIIMRNLNLGQGFEYFAAAGKNKPSTLCRSGKDNSGM